MDKKKIFNKEGTPLCELSVDQWLKGEIGNNAHVIELVLSGKGNYQCANVVLLLPDGRFESQQYHRTL